MFATVPNYTADYQPLPPTLLKPDLLEMHVLLQYFTMDNRYQGKILIRTCLALIKYNFNKSLLVLHGILKSTLFGHVGSVRMKYKINQPKP